MFANYTSSAFIENASKFKDIIIVYGGQSSLAPRGAKVLVEWGGGLNVGRGSQPSDSEKKIIAHIS